MPYTFIPEVLKTRHKYLSQSNLAIIEAFMNKLHVAIIQLNF